MKEICMFDGAAQTYDTDFTRTDLGRWLRTRVWQRLDNLFQVGDTVLEIGCGTGEDAVWLAQRGINILATDASTEMLAQTNAKAKSAGVAEQITTQLLNLNNLPSEALGQFDGIYSNFGAVNCTDDWTELADFLQKNVKVGGKIGMGIMSPFCLWESVWHGLHLDFKTATRRWNGQSEAALEDGAQFAVYYPRPQHLRQAFGTHFTQINLQGIGVFLPPSDVYTVIEKRPRLAQNLKVWEERLAHHSPFKHWADHYWIEFQRES